MIIGGDVTSLIAGYISNGWLTAYDGASSVVARYSAGEGRTAVVDANNNILNYAYNPSPADGPEISWAYEGLDLTWAAGDDANEHDVYFGTSDTGVAGADRSSSYYKGKQALVDTSYTLPDAYLDRGQT